LKIELDHIKYINASRIIIQHAVYQ
jgi:hypothetical protein